MLDWTNMEPLVIQPARGPLKGRVKIPGSKSLTNRALLVAALADGTSHISNLLIADDTRLMVDGLRALGIRIGVDESSCTAIVWGTGGHVPSDAADLYCGNSGTTIRFLTALCTLGMGTYRLHGNRRMCERPIGPLIDALRSLGGIVEFPDSDGYPPVIVHGRGLRGGRAVFDSPLSSQWISALLMTAPFAAGDLFLEVKGTCPSRPFIDMTLSVMSAFGAELIDPSPTTKAMGHPSEIPSDPSSSSPPASRWIVPAAQRYVGTDYTIEPDATNAAYFFAAAAVVGGRVTVPGLADHSAQGDLRFADVLERMGCTIGRQESELTVTGPASSSTLKGIDVDLGDMPDTAQTLAVVALLADGPTRIRNVAGLRVKETDRLAAVACELRRLGANVDVHDDGWMIDPPPRIHPARIHTYDDHRMAMSFAIAGLVVPGIEIDKPDCVAKTFPEFFDRWAELARR